MVPEGFNEDHAAKPHEEILAQN